MRTRHALIAGTTMAVVALFASAAAAGDHDSRGIAIESPIDSPDTEATHGLLRHYGPYVPYYGSPLTPISSRWQAVAYVPYYRGFCRPWTHYAQAPYGDAGVACAGPIEVPPGGTDFGAFTGAPRDEARLLHLGGNAPYEPSQPGTTDIIDVLSGGAHGPGCAAPR